jgi:single stranded DNA-binding protein
MSDLNMVIISGRVFKEPVYRAFPNNGGVTAIVVVTEERWRDDAGNDQSKSTFHNVDVFDKSADYVRDHIGKGDTVYIVGYIDNQKYGQEQTNTITKVVVKWRARGSIELLRRSAKRDASNNQQQSGYHNAPQQQGQYAPQAQHEPQGRAQPKPQPQYAAAKPAQAGYANAREQGIAPSNNGWDADRPFT